MARRARDLEYLGDAERHLAELLRWWEHAEPAEVREEPPPSDAAATFLFAKLDWMALGIDLDTMPAAEAVDALTTHLRGVPWPWPPGSERNPWQFRTFLDAAEHHIKENPR